MIYWSTYLLTNKEKVKQLFEALRKAMFSNPSTKLPAKIHDPWESSCHFIAFEFLTTDVKKLLTREDESGALDGLSPSFSCLSSNLLHIPGHHGVFGLELERSGAELQIALDHLRLPETDTAMIAVSAVIAQREPLNFYYSEFHTEVRRDIKFLNDQSAIYRDLRDGNSLCCYFRAFLCKRTEF